MSFLATAVWGWLIVGFILLALELLAPLTYFLWLGASALVTALVLFIVPEISWQAQFLVFSVLSVTSIVISRKYLVNNQTSSDQPNLNRRAQQYVGRVFTLSEAIEQGVGKVQVDDTYWQVTGPPLQQGTEVRVCDTQGSVLVVEAV
jgi:membrane protein implicated in regulation of membrane protease activity